jgi:hypothetical protein
MQAHRVDGTGCENSKHWPVSACTSPGSKKGYARIEDYIDSVVTGGIAARQVFKLMAIANLLKGPNALSEADVQVIPQENAYFLTKLNPERRTREVIKRAKATPTKKFQAEIQEEINQDLPPQEGKPIKVDFFRR